MAIGDTWETINTYAFVAGETIITADYENDVVNDLQYLYTHPSNAVNVYSGNTNTDVTLAASTNDILAGLTLTFTPVQDKVMLLIFYASTYGWQVSTSTNNQVGYKVGSGAITYIAQDATGAAANTNNGTLVTAEVTVTAGSSNTITMYMKNTYASSTTMQFMRVVAIEMAN
jgi:hypothetical protein